MIKLAYGALALIALPLSAQANALPAPYHNVGEYNYTTYNFQAQSTGDLNGYFVSKGSAVYNDRISVLVDGVLSPSEFGLDNQTSAFGSKFDFGEVTKGDTLTFVLENTTLGKDVYSDAARNVAYDGSGDALGHNHVYSTSYAGGVVDGVSVPQMTYVAFEDEAFSNSDLNYDDDAFVFTNTSVQAISGVPEPSTWLLMIAGIGGIGLMLRQVKKTMGLRFKDAFSA